MILLINICEEKLHYFEFVKPIEDILEKEKISYFVRDYKRVTKRDLGEADKIIICGTSLKDNKFIENIKRFDWIHDFNKPMLGICGGMQIIGLLFEGKLKKKTEIGFYFEYFKKDFLGLCEKQEVYHLHNNYVFFSNDFIEFTKSKINQAIKHNEREIYGILFHPEVRQKKLISNFCNL